MRGLSCAVLLLVERTSSAQGTTQDGRKGSAHLSGSALKGPEFHTAERVLGRVHAIVGTSERCLVSL